MLVVVVLEGKVPRLEGVDDVRLTSDLSERVVEFRKFFRQLKVRHEHVLAKAVHGVVPERVSKSCSQCAIVALKTPGRGFGESN